ncbi:MAG: YbaL family putative K(+) efflux transporter [Hyphomicrobiaceae bacterium]|nr:YbaL family putative K(+) efflux transporter [Hyphomicrobiaceae bacterium]
MPHHTPLVATIVIGISLAFVLGAVAHRLRISPIAGYLLAGIAVGPYTPGFVADQSMAIELAEIGIILLMFGVGLHFSFKDLMSVRAIAVPGALVQISVATGMGLALASVLGWPVVNGLIFGLALSVASTVVMLRALQERRLLKTDQGRIAVGWLVVEDIVMVLALVLLPAVTPLIDGSLERNAAYGANVTDVLMTALFTIGQVAAFVVVMLIVGQRVIPALLHYIAHTGSRELFRLGVLAIALGVAYGAAKLFGVSFALGAFFAGMILSESELSQRAAEETLPLRDAFAVLFFVSVGMLFNPLVLVTQTWPVLATVAIIVLGKSIAAFAIVRAFRYSTGTALLISASLAQIGEFSFILAGLGITLGVMSEAGRDLVLAGALLSILINPLLFIALDRLQPWLDGKAEAAVPGPGPKVPTKAPIPVQQAPLPDLENHVAIVGFGRVGSRIGDLLTAGGERLFIIDERDDVVASLVAKGMVAVAGSSPKALAAANLGKAKALVVAIPEVFEAGQFVEQARAANAALPIIAAGMTDAEGQHLTKCGATSVVLGAEEIAQAVVGVLPRQV